MDEHGRDQSTDLSGSDVVEYPVVLVYAGGLPAEIEERMRDAGAKIEVVPYGKERYNFSKEMGRINKENSISMAHVCFFDYFSFIPWIARVNGVKHIIYEELNSGMMTATSWKRKLLQLRTHLMSWPMNRVIAVSNFVKQDLKAWYCRRQNRRALSRR